MISKYAIGIESYCEVNSLLQWLGYLRSWTYYVRDNLSFETIASRDNWEWMHTMCACSQIWHGHQWFRDGV